MARRKTHEEYVAELAIKRPDIEVIEIYTNIRTPILHKCLKHNVFWKISPSNILRGRGCPICKKEAISKFVKKTHDEYVKELSVKNPNVVVLEKYVDARTRIKHRCLIHNVEWEITPVGALKGSGCPECKKDKLHKPRSWTQEKYVEALKQMNPDIISCEAFVNVSTKILHKCNVCGYEWYATPSNILSGTGCPKCAGCLKKTHEQYIEELKLKAPNVIAVEKYVNAVTPIKHKCKIHNVEWFSLPSNVLAGKSCPLCKIEKLSKSNFKTNSEYISELKEANPHIIALEEYKGIYTPIKHKCLKHGIEWMVTPVSILRGYGCKECVLEVVRGKTALTQEQYINRLKVKYPDIIPTEKYINNHTPIMHKCLSNGYEWKGIPADILIRGCPTGKKSVGEITVRNWLDEHDICYECQKKFNECKNINPLPFDFYLPDYNLCIEYDGEQHYRAVDFWGGEEAFEKRVYLDNIKNKYCEENNINLLRISYKDDIEETLNNFYLFQ